MDIVIQIEGDEVYDFYIEVTDFYRQKPLGKWADSRDDAEGYTDLEWECYAAGYCTEDGVKVVLSDDEKDKLVCLYEKQLDAKVMEHLEEMANDY